MTLAHPSLLQPCDVEHLPFFFPPLSFTDRIIRKQWRQIRLPSIRPSRAARRPWSTRRPTTFNGPPLTPRPTTTTTSKRSTCKHILPLPPSETNPPQSTQETSPPTKPQYHESIIEPVAKPAQVTPLTQLGESEATIACPHCKYRAKTKVSTEDTNMTTYAPSFPFPSASPSPEFLPQVTPNQHLWRRPLPNLHLRRLPALPVRVVPGRSPRVLALREASSDAAAGWEHPGLRAEGHG